MTNNQIVEAKGDFLTNPQLLNSGIIRKYLDPQGKASDEELAYFIAQAKAQNLNPFTKEIYFIKYGNQPAQIVTAKAAFEKKADSHPQFDGSESGVIYEQNGEIKRSNGAFIPKGADILGGWAKVYRKDRSHPTEIEVSFEEYDNSKIRKEGEVNSYGKPNKPNTWDNMPCVMIRKVALVTAYREAFPAELGSSYDADELQLDTTPKDVTPVETQEEVKARKMAQIEQMKKEQTQKQEDTSYPTDDVIDPGDEQVQGELLEDLEY
ncbi:phage recombination protein Bet [Streptococcus pluranimalium]|uniref:phage recombination protein Bet n=1 Tax=Streptococcus pluranimalium TaxID=82348 RepID=UPI0039FD3DAF